MGFRCLPVFLQCGITLVKRKMPVNKKKYTFLTTAPVPRVIGKMALPTIISMMVTSVYNIVDTYFVSQLDTQSTAAVGISFTVIAIFQAIGFFFGHGAGNYIAISLGADDELEARNMVITGYVYALGSAVIIGALGLLFLRPLCLGLGCTPTILPYSEQYLRYILLSAPFIVGSLLLNVQIRQQGNAAYAMVGIMSGAVLNIVLDPLLIFTFNMGIRGAGMATLFSQMLSCFVLMLMTHKGGNLPLRLKYFSFKRKYIRLIFAGGTPSLTRQGLGSLATLLLNTSAAVYGDAAIAGMTIVTRITFLICSMVIGLGQGFQPLCGFCYGARLYERVAKGFRFCVLVGTAFMLFVAVVGYFFSSEIVALFRDDAQVVSIGSKALRWQSLTYPLCAVILLGNMLMQSINKTGRANLLAAARRGVCFIPLLLILPRFYGLQGLIICQPLADICAISLTLPVLFYTFRELKTGAKA